MEFSITYISGNRKLGKAYRRIYSEIEKLNQSMVEKLSPLVDVDRVEFWLVDKPLDYIEVVKRASKLIEIHCGVDEKLSYFPSDDTAFLENIKAGLDKVEGLFPRGSLVL